MRILYEPRMWHGHILVLEAEEPTTESEPTRQYLVPEAMHPTLKQTLLLVNGAMMYTGGLFVYMGVDVSNDVCQWLSSGTIVPAAATFMVGLGIIVAFVGGFGGYTTLYRTKRSLAMYKHALECLMVLLFVSGVMGLVMLVQATSWPNSADGSYAAARAHYLESFSGRVCPIVLGHACHSMNLTDASHQSLMPSPAPSARAPDSYEGRNNAIISSDANDKVVGAAMYSFIKAGSFADACKTLPPSMADPLSQEFYTACAVCQAVAPVSSLMSWMHLRGQTRLHDEPYLYIHESLAQECIRRLAPLPTTRRMEERHVGTSRANNFVSLRFFQEWKQYATALTVTSGVLLAHTAVLRREAQRTLQRWRFTTCS